MVCACGTEHQENDPSEGGTGNVPYAPGMQFQCVLILIVH